MTKHMKALTENEDSAAQMKSGKRHVKRATNNFTGAATAKAQEISGAVKEGAQGYVDAARDQINEQLGDWEGHVRSNPGKAVLGAAAIGFLLGSLFRR